MVFLYSLYLTFVIKFLTKKFSLVNIFVKNEELDT